MRSISRKSGIKIMLGTAAVAVATALAPGGAYGGTTNSIVVSPNPNPPSHGGHHHHHHTKPTPVAGAQQ